ncbi:MAG: phage tail protein [Methylobacter sp.]
MAKPIFTWYPDEGSEELIKPNVKVTKFGDGYEQRTPVGINPDVQTWSLTFTGDAATILPIRAFLKARGASESFQWTSPLNEWGIYVCREYPLKKISAGVLQIPVKFERVYEANT